MSCNLITEATSHPFCHIRGKQLGPHSRGGGLHGEHQGAGIRGHHLESALHQVIDICAPGKQQSETGSWGEPIQGCAQCGVGHKDRHPELKPAGARSSQETQGGNISHWFHWSQSPHQLWDPRRYAWDCRAAPCDITHGTITKSRAGSSDLDVPGAGHRQGQLRATQNWLPQQWLEKAAQGGVWRWVWYVCYKPLPKVCLGTEATPSPWV